MNEINASDLLSQIRTLGRDLQPRQTVVTPSVDNFGDMLKSSINCCE